MMGGDIGSELAEKIREMEERASVDVKTVKVNDIKKKQKKAMEENYM